MSFLSAGAVAELRRAAEEGMVHRCDLGKVTRAHAPGGGRTESFTPQYENVPCALTPAGAGGVRRSASRDQLAPPPAAWRLALPVRQEMAGITRVVVRGTDAAGEAWSRSLVVVRVEAPPVEAVRVVWCDEPQGTGA